MAIEQQGIDYKRYRLIPRTLIFLRNANHTLLIKGSDDKKVWASKYNGIGGHIERGENILIAAKRELLEETGLTVKDLWLCGVVTVDTRENTGIGIYVFRGESVNGELKPSPEGELEWIKDNEYQSLPLVDDLHIMLPKVVAMRKGDMPFIAHSHYNTADRLILTFAH